MQWEYVWRRRNKDGTNKSEGVGGKRVHHRSLVAALNQLLTLCRLAAEPTNDAMMAVSFPRTAAYPGTDAEWENDRGRTSEAKSSDERWIGKKKSCSKNLFGSFILLVDKDRRDNARASEECDVFVLRQKENEVVTSFIIGGHFIKKEHGDKYSEEIDICQLSGEITKSIVFLKPLLVVHSGL